MVDELAERRARESNTKWTPKNAAEQFLFDIAAGRIKPSGVIILYQVENEDSGIGFNAYLANMPRDREIALLEAYKHYALNDWIR